MNCSVENEKSSTILMAGCKKWKPFIVMLVISFVFSVLNILFKKMLSEGMNQLVLITYRLIASTIFLLPIAFFIERRNGVKLTIPILGLLFFSALIGATLNQYLNLVGMKYTSAAFASAFTNLTPVFTFILALVLREESVNLKRRGGQAKVLGSLICFGGVLVLIFYKGIQLNKLPSSENGKNSNMVAKGDNDHQKWIIGSISLILGIVLWSGWFVVQARISKKYPCKYSSTALMSLFGAIQAASLCFALNRDITVWILRGKLQILTVLSAGILVSGVCYTGMAWCVEKEGAVFTSAFSPFVQIYIIILDLVFHTEQIHLGSVVGSILVICGLYVLLWGKSREAAENISKPSEQVECNGFSTSVSDVTQIAKDSTCP